MLLLRPGPEQIECQYPKPILLNVGEAHTPYDWSPNIVDIQVFRVGQFVIVVSPGEATTMSGRRWREAVYNAAASSIVSKDTPPIVVLGGPANSYTHYIATEEEYSVQRYEGASTLYGPHTLNAYINATLKYLPFLSPILQQPQVLQGPAPRPEIAAFLSACLSSGARKTLLAKSTGKHFGQITTRPMLAALSSLQLLSAQTRVITYVLKAHLLL